MAVGVNWSNNNLAMTNYVRDIVETLNYSSNPRRLISQNKDGRGSHFEGRLHEFGNHGIAGVGDLGAFPAAGNQGYLTWKAYRKGTVAAVQVSDFALYGVAGNNSFKSVYESETKGVMRDVMLFESGMFYGDGTGEVALVKENASGGSDTSLIVDDSRMMWKNASFQVYPDSGFSAGTSTSRGTVTVSARTEAPTTDGYATVTLSSAMPSAVVSGDHVVWNNTYMLAKSGLNLLVDNTLSTNFQNIDVSSATHYTSYVDGNGGTERPFSPNLFRKTLAAVKSKCGNDTPAEGLDVLCSNWGSVEVEELFEGDLRLSPTDTVGGLAIASFQSTLGKINVITDALCPYRQMFFIDPSKIFRGVIRELDWRRGDGNLPILMPSQTSGVNLGTLLEICEYYITERNTSARIDDIDVTIATMF